MKKFKILSVILATVLVFCAFPLTIFANDYYDKDWPKGTFSSLDTGIYWYSDNNDMPVKAGSSDANYDPSKPTIIFCHGNKVNEGYNRREVLTLYQKTNVNFKSAGYDKYEFGENEAQYFLDLGYNVGSFYWNQLSDDDLDCDVKIWSSTDKEHKMRYAVLKDGKRVVKYDSGLTDSVSVMLGKEIIKDLGDNFSGTLQLAGHSMGGQLVIATSQYLLLTAKNDETKEKFVPSRVTLMDPYFGGTVVNSKINATGEACKGKTISELSADAMEDCANNGIAFEAYGASVKYINRLYSVKMALGDEKAKADEITKKLTDNCAWVYLDALQGTYTASKSHCMVIDYYFSTAKESAKTDNLGNPVPYALLDTITLKTLKGNGYSQQNVSGNTFYMHTANFIRVNADLTQLDTNQPSGAVFISTDFGNENYTVNLLNSSKSIVSSSKLSSAGEIKFSSLSAGQYTFQITDENGEEVKLAEDDVTLSSNSDIELVNAQISNGIIGEASGIFSIIESNPLVTVGIVVAIIIIAFAVVVVKKKK